MLDKGDEIDMEIYVSDHLTGDEVSKVRNALKSVTRTDTPDMQIWAVVGGRRVPRRSAPNRGNGADYPEPRWNLHERAGLKPNGKEITIPVDFT